MPRDVVVIGASADGVSTLQELVRPLPADLPAALLVVLHTGPKGGTILPDILTRAGSLPATVARDGEPIRRGQIYVPPRDAHLLVDGGRLRVHRGPRENGFRPAIDPLFRTAARSLGPRVVGVILSGLLDDGALGLRHVVDRGGAGLVQDPKEATFPPMPLAALQRCPAARAMPVAAIAEQIIALASAGNGGGPIVAPSPSDEEGADPVEAGDILETAAPEEYGNPTMLTCPDCGGTLQEVADGNLVRYRCHTGHGFTPATLLQGQEELVEDAMWNALRALEESAALRRNMAQRASGGGLDGLSVAYERQAEDLIRRAHSIRRVLQAPPIEGPDATTVPVGGEQQG